MISEESNSSPCVLHAKVAFIGREEKKIWTANHNGSKLRLLPCSNTHHEVNRIAQDIRRQWQDGAVDFLKSQCLLEQNDLRAQLR